MPRQLFLIILGAIGSSMHLEHLSFE